MRAMAILPVKRFGLAKQRLDAHVDAESRTALASAMLSDVLAALGETRTLDAVAIVSAEPAVERHVDGSRVHLVRDEVERGQSEAALAGLAWAAGLDTEVAVLVPGDCPVVEPDDINALVEKTAEVDVAIVPDRHRRGTNAIGLHPGAGFTPQFGPDSLARHVRQAQRRDLRHSVLPLTSLALDVDTLDDLVELAAVIRRAPQRAPKTHALLQQMEQVSRLPGLSAA